MAEPLVSFRDVHLSFDRPILRGVSFDLHPGATKIVLGGSGSGKTTILRLILGLLRPDAGSIRVEGQEITAGAQPGLLRGPGRGAVRDQGGSACHERTHS